MMLRKKNLCKSFIIVLLFVISNNVSAQNATNDVIYINNGSIIKGEIVEIKTDEYVKIKSQGGNVWVFKNTEIEKILKDEKIALAGSQENIQFVDNGAYTDFSIGFLYGTGNENANPPLSVLVGGGYTFKNNISLGLLTGVELLDDAFLPTMINFDYTFVNTKFSHFIFLQGGYSFVIDNSDDNIYYYNNDETKNYGGIVINPGFGVKWNIDHNNAIAVSIGYRYQRNRYTYNDYNNQEIERTVKYNRISVRFGYHF
jgi:hypothetical protein